MFDDQEFKLGEGIETKIDGYVLRVEQHMSGFKCKLFSSSGELLQDGEPEFRWESGLDRKISACQVELVRWMLVQQGKDVNDAESVAEKLEWRRYGSGR